MSLSQAREALGLSAGCSCQQLMSAYFQRALPFHPDIARAAKAPQRFWKLSQAYWRLAVDLEVEHEEFTERGIRELWVRNFVFEGLPELVADELQMTSGQCEERFFEASTRARGMIPGERLQCGLCGFQVRSHSEMRSHLSQHKAGASWAEEAMLVKPRTELWEAAKLELQGGAEGRKRLNGSFGAWREDAGAAKHGEACCQVRAGCEEFLLADGSVARFKDIPLPPEIDLDVPMKASAAEMLQRLRATRPGLAAYLEPEGDPDLSAALRYQAISPESPRTHCREPGGSFLRRVLSAKWILGLAAFGGSRFRGRGLIPLDEEKRNSFLSSMWRGLTPLAVWKKKLGCDL
ncbi:unnamed protein product [Effrenium voratum]|nr:unnamed protein product [Effrenium voratum]